MTGVVLPFQTTRLFYSRVYSVGLQDRTCLAEEFFSQFFADGQVTTIVRDSDINAFRHIAEGGDVVITNISGFPLGHAVMWHQIAKVMSERGVYVLSIDSSSQEIREKGYLADEFVKIAMDIMEEESPKPTLAIMSNAPKFGETLEFPLVAEGERYALANRNLRLPQFVAAGVGYFSN